MSPLNRFVIADSSIHPTVYRPAVAQHGADTSKNPWATTIGSTCSMPSLTLPTYGVVGVGVMTRSNCTHVSLSSSPTGG